MVYTKTLKNRFQIWIQQQQQKIKWRTRKYTHQSINCLWVGCKFYSEYCIGTAHVQVHLVKYMYRAEAPVTTTVGQLYKLILWQDTNPFISTAQWKYSYQINVRRDTKILTCFIWMFKWDSLMSLYWLKFTQLLLKLP